MTDQSGVMRAADGTPLKRSLARALRRQKLRALALVTPLLIFVLITFVIPIGSMLFRSVENQIVANTLPETVRALRGWEPEAGLPDGETFNALYIDLWLAEAQKLHTRLGSRLNYELSGASSLFRKSGRRVGRFDTDEYTEQFVTADAAWEAPQTWMQVTDDAASAAALPLTARTWDRWIDYLEIEGDDPLEEDVEDFLFAALHADLLRGGDFSAALPIVQSAAEVAPAFGTVDLLAAFEDADKDWADLDIWRTLKTYTPPYTAGYFLNAVDLKQGFEGVETRPQNERIYVTLFGRTLWMSLVITATCVILGYPVAWLLANLPTRKANVLLILVLLPFWTSLLVRTSAWKVLLQQQGVINDTLVWIGLVDDANRFVMINNQFGTIVAMTHILLPFMILPMYSVMQTIQPSYLRAAKSLGATNWTAFWRVYFPQSVPGIGAGSILVFILAIGYYITPEIVGGTKGVFISNRIAFHISSSLNWGLAAALGTILLVAVLILYWAYDRIVGIDNVKLG